MEKLTGALIEGLHAQHYLLLLIGVMVASGIIKDHGLFNDIFRLIIARVKNKKIVLALISLISGILPISGRVVVSAGVLSLITSDKAIKSGGREKFGIIDYLSTHHYYLWSPLEKTVIVPMAALSLSWPQFMAYSLPLLAISIVYIFWYIGVRVEENEISIVDSSEPINWLRLLRGFAPFMVAIFAIIIYDSWSSYIMLDLAIYYIIATESYDFKKINSYIKWNLVGFLALIIFFGKITACYGKEIEVFIRHSTWLDIHTLTGAIAISLLAFGASWFMGSSGKFAGLLAILVSIYGPQYLVWFFCMEFAGYNFSPAHKCVPIGKLYFNTPLTEYASALSVWMGLLISYAGIRTFVF
ncbi:MAG: hypothetical protein WCG01_02800 [bacterium]